jgi:serine/threonine protein kinase
MSLEKYSIDKLIGKGSYGEVYLAKHKKDKKTVSPSNAANTSLNLML